MARVTGANFLNPLSVWMAPSAQAIPKAVQPVLLSPIETSDRVNSIPHSACRACGDSNKQLENRPHQYQGAHVGGRQRRNHNPVDLSLHVFQEVLSRTVRS